MRTLAQTAFSMLDLVPVREGRSVADALAVSLQTARHAERLGFTRYWLAEHHNMAGIASSARPCWWGTSRAAPSASALARAA